MMRRRVIWGRQIISSILRLRDSGIVLLSSFFITWYYNVSISKNGLMIVSYDPPLFILSLLISLVASAAALYLLYFLRDAPTN